MIDNMSASRGKDSVSRIAFLIFAAVFVMTPISQIPDLKTLDFIKNLLDAVCILSAGFMILAKPSKLFQVRLFWLAAFVLIFIGYCAMMNYYTGEGYMWKTYFRTALLSAFLYFLGFYAAEFFGEKELKKLLTIFFVGTIITALIVFAQVYTSVSDWLGNASYAYSSKNSICIIVTTAILGVMFYAVPKKRLFRILELGGCAFLVYFLIIIQSRTAIFAFISAIIFYILFVSKKRAQWLVLVTLALIAVLMIDSTREIIIKSLRLDNTYIKEGQTVLDAFMSSRLSYVAAAIETIARNPLFGSGSYYVDMMYVSIVAEMGLVGALLPLTLMCMVFGQNIKIWRRSSKITKPLGALLVMVTLQAAVESVGEGLQPFGPGTCVLVFWFLCGFSWKLSREAPSALETSGNAEAGLTPVGAAEGMSAL